ncbi:hypothetical protein DRN38_00185 [Thermococci archaeon]|nr:MAG: hypothetical protein DRN38_00185 [Thermococci archaeon]
MSNIPIVDYTEPWDWLIILDACRFDFFEKYAFPKIRSAYPIARLEKRISLASETTGVLERFPKLNNVIVLTGHPFVLQRKDKFPEIIDAKFDYELSTCPPWYMYASFMVHKNRLLLRRRRILWFLQPHHPFIGKTRLNVRIYEGGKSSPLHGTEKIVREYRMYKEKGLLIPAYRDNLLLVTNYVLRMLKHIEGKIIITSDHGDGLGLPLRPEDPPILSHPADRKEWELRLIPWCIIHKGIK